MTTFDFPPCPLVAILRGLTVKDAESVGQILFSAGFRLLEVPLNREGALDTIRVLRRIASENALVGGGTMLTKKDVDLVKEAGGQLMVSPNCEPEVISHAVELGLIALPGVATPTEAFRALDAGAQALKLFPAEMIPPVAVKAMRSVLPPDVPLLPVGGIKPESMSSYVAAGATGFGIGSQLYKPGVDAEALRQMAKNFMLARDAILASR
ncbi:2-dehydro-3-deoxy-6-phosphogalactonate aldolase [Noviherbaspirillum massiliense]|uniref:2-dehydro-3-deoxy-6-phosphogalactonate aldolase n=1 Tax=Noviherbaspirillum massiliense TaxID=1465823 RepID=UPI00030EC67B|nr:2-dehydro-3-deoxy-6-phosphogalactonate aldolase [Noviherbaspirillum massiliense]